MAEIVRYVDPDATGTGSGLDWTNAYTSLSAAESGIRVEGYDNLVTSGDWLHIYCRSSAGTADTTTVSFSALWTTDATHYILVEAASGDEAVKTGWDATRYRLSVTGDLGINSRVSFIRYRGLQIENTATAAIYFGTVTAGGDQRIENCRLRDGGGSSNRGITVEDADTNLTVENTIIESFPYDGIFVNAAATVGVYHCVIYGSGYDGIEFTAGTGILTNNAVFGTVSDADFDITGGSVTIDHNASDDGSSGVGGTNDVIVADWSTVFEDHTTGDFTLIEDSDLYHAGVTAAGANLSTDIDGEGRYASAPSIGVDDFFSIRYPKFSYGQRPA